MKRLVFAFIILVASAVSVNVIADNETEKIFVKVDQLPAYPGGTDAMIAFLSSNIKYPSIAVENHIEGRVVVQFVVEKDGEITNVKVVKSVDPSLDKEAIRVISMMPKWRPGMQGEKAVRVTLTMPVSFKLPKQQKSK